ncbi:M23 family metallopeptidase [Oculatella sp. LEGE 06141]|uniref:M23 family metallopeptidase n=1 Tax=Oculatella sp. LEGE 06141 TaxID=1828648 RepID=UPI0018819EDA|nr:M23 family metallopeptidase [Oculatella sp. LEGE 06141]MBE9182403.1 M23 family metallopeptidase [Oculatella sp. LEGE 06141]
MLTEEQSKEFLEAMKGLQEGQKLTAQALTKQLEAQYFQAKIMQRQIRRASAVARWYLAAASVAVVTLVSIAQPFMPKNQSAVEVPEGQISSPAFRYFQGETLKKGDSLGAYQVGDIVGMRTDPFNGEQRMHNGVDIRTPSGTALHAPGAITVACKEETGMGRYAEFTFNDRRILLGHLQSCVPGRANTGDTIAYSGNSGKRTTGAHLHFEVWQNDQPQQVTKSLAEAVVLNQQLPNLRINGGTYQGLSDEQNQVASAYVSKGREMEMSDREITIALMTGLQESGLKNLTHGDDWWFAKWGWGKSDSLGSLQQRDSWGSRECRLDPACAVELFYNAMKKVPNRDAMSLNDVAATIQRPAAQYRGHYAKHENKAREILSRY